MNTLSFGPVLGLETAHDGNYYTCLVACARQPVWRVDGMERPFVMLGKLANGNTLWRAEWKAPEKPPVERMVGYSVEVDSERLRQASGVDSWQFHVPAAGKPLRFVYGSCNGFSSKKLMASTSNPHAMWERLVEDHRCEPLSLLVLGGDQIYADSLWEQPWLEDFAALKDNEMVCAPVTAELDAALDGFYESLYLRQWGVGPVAAMLASVPSLMMWDDHDIFDGWGSHPEALQKSPVYQRIYMAALRAFRLFQLRGNLARGFLEPGAPHHAYAVHLAGESFLMLDHRSERSSAIIMSASQWSSFKKWIASFDGPRLFVQSAVPVVYRTFSCLERLLHSTERREEVEDDLNDHWSAREHQKERLRFIHTLLERQRELRPRDGSAYHPRWILLSGDVHVGCMGSVWEVAQDLGLYQVVSSGIVHPPPTPLQWLGILAVSGDGEERLGNGDLQTEIHPIAGARAKFLRTRNYARLELEAEGVWVNWRCENEGETVFKI